MSFFYDLWNALSALKVTDRTGKQIDISEASPLFVRWAKECRAAGGRLLFIGNGGSAAIASHMAADWQKNGGFSALCFNDGAALTCLANDLGYEHVFAAPIKVHARNSDMLIAVSSSGLSPNIIAGVKAAGAVAKVITLSGFKAGNDLRQMGDLNFYIDSDDYGLVECAHLAVLHSALNEAML